MKVFFAFCLFRLLRNAYRDAKKPDDAWAPDGSLADKSQTWLFWTLVADIPASILEYIWEVRLAFWRWVDRQELLLVAWDWLSGSSEKLEGWIDDRVATIEERERLLSQVNWAVDLAQVVLPVTLLFERLARRVVRALKTAALRVYKRLWGVLAVANLMLLLL